MGIKFKGIEQIKSEGHTSESIEELEQDKIHSAESVHQAIDSLITTYIHFASKDNEGQQALIFKYELETNLSTFDDEDRAEVENYIGSAKSFKILKVTNQEAAETEFNWHHKAYELYKAIPDDEKHKYAGIPKPYINKNIEIDETTRQKLNTQNANIKSDEASVIVMDWVEGEDLLVKVLRRYLQERPGYQDTANDPLVSFRSLIIAVSGDFRTRGMDFEQLETLDQYKKMFNVISRKGELLTSKQQEQIKNTLDLLHKNHIYHNDLHLRNYIIEDGTGKVYIIDFGRSTTAERPFENDIKDDMILNFAKEYISDDAKKEVRNAGIENEIKRIIERDRSFPALLKEIKSKNASDLLIFMERESSQWRVDNWNVKRHAAVIRELEKSDPNRAALLKEYMKDKKNLLTVDGANVVEYITN